MLDRLKFRARRGDVEAIELLISMLPPEPSPAARRILRDTCIRELMDWLAYTLPGATIHQRARLAAAAGAELQTRRRLGDHAPFAGLTDDERSQLGEMIRPHLDCSCWPGWRQVLRIADAGRMPRQGGRQQPRRQSEPGAAA